MEWMFFKPGLGIEYVNKRKYQLINKKAGAV
jgi:hypothetical protein